MASLKFVLSQIVLIIISKNINNSAMKDTDSMKEIINKNVDMESNKKQEKTLKKILEPKKKLYP